MVIRYSKVKKKNKLLKQPFLAMLKWQNNFHLLATKAMQDVYVLNTTCEYEMM